jgi:hypothetical protein
MRILSITMLVIGAVIALAGWLLLWFYAITVVSFPSSRLAAVLPLTLAIIEALVVAYGYRKRRSYHLDNAVNVVWLFNVANVAFVIFFWGGL